MLEWLCALSYYSEPMPLKRLSFQQTLLSLILSLLFWSALFPAHFSHSQKGRVIELCTRIGMQQVWVDDSRDSMPWVAAAPSGTAAAPLTSEHGEPHCAWCVMSVPSLVFFALLLFFTPRLRHIIATPRTAPLRLRSTLWRFSCPRAPPVCQRVFA